MKAGKDYSIFPLDVSSREEAVKYVSVLKEEVGLFKVGLELFVSEGPAIIKTIREITDAGIFLDLKLHDIPETMRRALLTAAQYQPEFVTVDCDQGEGMMKEVAWNNAGNTKILAITLLTSINTRNLATLGYKDQYVNDLSALVLLRANIAREAGCHGVVCSGQEVARIKKELPDLIAVTRRPGRDGVVLSIHERQSRGPALSRPSGSPERHRSAGRGSPIADSGSGCSTGRAVDQPGGTPDAESSTGMRRCTRLRRPRLPKGFHTSSIPMATMAVATTTSRIVTPDPVEGSIPPTVPPETTPPAPATAPTTGSVPPPDGVLISRLVLHLSRALLRAP